MSKKRIICPECGSRTHPSILFPGKRVCENLHCPVNLVVPPRTKSRKEFAPPTWFVFVAPRACAMGPVGLVVDVALWTFLVALVLKAAGVL